MRLDERGLLRDGVLTEAGSEFREQIELRTDRLDTAPLRCWVKRLRMNLSA